MPALSRPHWPRLSRRLLITAGVFLAAFIIVTLIVVFGGFTGLNGRLTTYLQHRGSTAQDIALGLFTYLGSAELTLVISALIGLALFRGLRLLAVLPVAFVLAGSVLEVIGKNVIGSPAPPLAINHFPSFLPHLSHNVGQFSYPSGHVLRATITYGLVLYLSERWELFGKDSSRLSPVLVLMVFLIGYAVVYLGWHWFSDAVGGLLLGLTLLFGLIAYLERKRTVNPGLHPQVDD
ncbi:MAG TPA: phosphatase PAP2 family protein [Candidatus Dormibacteraeota bacterium]